MRVITIATEDELSEQVGLRLAKEARLEVNLKLRKNGNGYLRGSLTKFAEMSLHNPVLLITDLDRLRSAQHLKTQWFGAKTQPPNFLFHVAVREVEAWLIADHVGIKKLLGEKIGKLPTMPETLGDPKVALLSMASKAPREIRSDLVAERNSMAAQGFGYNARLGEYVRRMWQPSRAAERSPSLEALMLDLHALAKVK